MKASVNLSAPSRSKRQLVPFRSVGRPQQRRTAAAGFTAPNFFTELLAKLSVTNTKAKLANVKGTELLNILAGTEVDKASEVRVAQLVEELVAESDEQVLDERLLGGGPWVVRYTRGTPFLWSATWSAGKLINSNNRASQDFDPYTRSVVNKVEYAGGGVYVTASGTYEPQGDDDGQQVVLPQVIEASITSGNLHAFNRDIPLPIRGKGTFEVLYCDGAVRIFRSNRRIAVQVRADKLPAEPAEALDS